MSMVGLSRLTYKMKMAEALRSGGRRAEAPQPLLPNSGGPWARTCLGGSFVASQELVPFDRCRHAHLAAGLQLGTLDSA